MNARLRDSTFVLLLTALSAGSLVAAGPRADVLPSARRSATMDLAARFSKEPPAPSLPEDAVNPFSPPTFLAPDPEEARAMAEAAARRATQAPVSRPTTDRELLTIVAQQLRPNGVVSMGGELILMLGGRKLRSGDKLPVTYEGQTFNLTLSAIERTQFTLRLNRDEITRPIK